MTLPKGVTEMANYLLDSNHASPLVTLHHPLRKRFLLKASLTCYQLDEIDGERAAELQVLLRKRGWQLETVDALVAAVALRYGLTLLTSDKDFSAVPHLVQENWLLAA